MSLSLTLEVLRKYKSQVFVETGTFKGGGIEVAMAAGFNRIISIEVHAPYYNKQKSRFADQKNVEVILGDSGQILWKVISGIECPITFWLDGHIHLDGKSDKETPILEELSAIAQHPIKDHKILIDDRGAMGTELWGHVSEEQVVGSLMMINPAYRILFENSSSIVGDILVATTRDTESVMRSATS